MLPSSRTSPAPVRGQELLLAVGIPAAIIGGILADLFVGRRVLHLTFIGQHRAAFSALFLLVGYLAILLGLLVAFGGFRGLSRRLGFRVTSWAWLALAPFIWFGVVAASAIIEIPLSHFFGQPPSNTVQLLQESRDPLYFAVVAPTAGLLAPAMEEMLFRGAIFGWLRLRVPVPIAAVVSAALFGGAHLAPLLFPFLFLFGLVAAIVYEYSGSTLNTFVMHAIQNTTALVVTYILVSRAGT